MQGENCNTSLALPIPREVKPIDSLLAPLLPPLLLLSALRLQRGVECLNLPLLAGPLGRHQQWRRIQRRRALLVLPGGGVELPVVGPRPEQQAGGALGSTHVPQMVQRQPGARVVYQRRRLRLELLVPQLQQGGGSGPRAARSDKRALLPSTSGDSLPPNSHHWPARCPAACPWGEHPQHGSPPATPPPACPMSRDEVHVWLTAIRVCCGSSTLSPNSPAHSLAKDAKLRLPTCRRAARRARASFSFLQGCLQGAKAGPQAPQAAGGEMQGGPGWGSERARAWHTTVMLPPAARHTPMPSAGDSSMPTNCRQAGGPGRQARGHAAQERYQLVRRHSQHQGHISYMEHSPQQDRRCC